MILLVAHMLSELAVPGELLASIGLENDLFEEGPLYLKRSDLP